MIRDAIDALPLWGVLATTMIIVTLAIELGYQTGRWRSRNRVFDSEALLSSMTGAHLALLAFLMAFSFSMAAGHYSDRKAILLDEANAIGTAHLRTSLVQKAGAREIADLLAAYAVIRDDTRSDEQAVTAIARSVAIHEEIWEQIQNIAAQPNPNILDSLLIQSVNEVFDQHELRVAAGLRNRVPPSLWVTLLTLLTLSMAGIGYFSGIKGQRNPIASTGLALSFSLVMFLIADLDRPGAGLVKSDHTAIAELANKLNQ